MSSHTQNFICAIVRDVEVFLQTTGMAESTFGKTAATDSTVVERLRKGQVTLRTVEKIESYIRDNRIYPNRSQATNRKSEDIAAE